MTLNNKQGGMNMTNQDNAVNALVAKGWRVDLNDGDTVYLSRRNPKLRQTLYCQVDADGVVN